MVVFHTDWARGTLGSGILADLGAGMGVERLAVQEVGTGAGRLADLVVCMGVVHQAAEDKEAVHLVDTGLGTAVAGTSRK